MIADNASPRVFTAIVSGLLLLATVHAGGYFQSGRLNGAIYAGGLDYTDKNIYATGITYGTNGYFHSDQSMCFVSKFRFGHLNDHEKIITGIMGDGSSMEACHATSLMHDSTYAFNDGDDKPFLVAATSDHHMLFGNKNAVDVDPTGVLTAHKPWEKGDFPMDGRVAIDAVGETNGLSYPVSVVYKHNRYDEEKNGEDDGIGFIASLTTKSKSPNLIDPLLGGIKNQPNWMKYYKYGSSFELSLQKYRVKLDHGTTNINHKYTSTFAVNEDKNGNKPDVFVGGMVLTREKRLIVAGSTSGSGAAYGGLSFSQNSDLDGFISVFHHDLRLREEKPSARVGTAETDLILGMCEDANDDVIYIVGMTEYGPGMGDQLKHQSIVTEKPPKGSMYGFVQKIDVATLKKEWGVYWSAKAASAGGEEPTTTTAVGCQHLSDGTLYVAGIAENGAKVLEDDKTKHEGDNIVAMRLGSDTGKAKWITQFGSMNGDENLARSGALAVDGDENLVVYGDTTGSLFRKRNFLDKTDVASDIFLATLSKKEGTHDHLVHSEHWKEPTAEKVGMLAGGNWTDAEVHGTNDLYSDDWIATQSGPTDGSVFAGGMVYDKVEDTAYVAGIFDTPKRKVSSCMVSKLALRSGEFIGWSGAQGNAYGQEDVLEVCNSIALHGYGEALAVGYSEKGSNLPGSDIASKYPLVGFGLMLDRNNIQEVDAIPFVTDNPHKRFQYPIDVVSDGDDVYILSLTSTDKELTSEYNEVMNDIGPFSPNWINIQKFGSSFDMTVTKITIQREMIDGVSMGKVSLTTEWSNEFPVDTKGDNTGTIPRVFLGGLSLQKSKGYLAVSGSTRGMGAAYGAATGSDEDGFVTAIDMNSGELLKSIREGTDEDDFVSGMCRDENDDTSFYIVGYTKGIMDEYFDSSDFAKGSKYAYLRKVNADSLRATWTVQLGALRKEDDGGPNRTPTTAKAIDCVVNDGAVYVAGIVDDNAGMLNGNKVLNSRGGDDIWFGSFNSDVGSMNWLRQEGSEKTDHIAPHGAMAIKKNGNILIFGDTNGQFFRRHTDADRNLNELFLLEVEKDGKHKPAITNPNHNGITHPASHEAIETISESASEASEASETTSPPFLVKESLIDDDSQSDGGNGGNGGKIVLGIVGTVVAILVVVVLFYLIRKQTGLGARKSSQGATDGVFNVKAPPQSSFQDPLPENYNDNIQAKDKDIV